MDIEGNDSCIGAGACSPPSPSVLRAADKAGEMQRRMSSAEKLTLKLTSPSTSDPKTPKVTQTVAKTTKSRNQRIISKEYQHQKEEDGEQDHEKAKEKRARQQYSPPILPLAVANNTSTTSVDAIGVPLVGNFVVMAAEETNTGKNNCKSTGHVAVERAVSKSDNDGSSGNDNNTKTIVTTPTSPTATRLTGSAAAFGLKSTERQRTHKQQQSQQQLQKYRSSVDDNKAPLPPTATEMQENDAGDETKPIILKCSQSSPPERPRSPKSPTKKSLHRSKGGGGAGGGGGVPTQSTKKSYGKTTNTTTATTTPIRASIPSSPPSPSSPAQQLQLQSNLKFESERTFMESAVVGGGGVIIATITKANSSRGDEWKCNKALAAAVSSPSDAAYPGAVSSSVTAHCGKISHKLQTNQFIKNQQQQQTQQSIASTNKYHKLRVNSGSGSGQEKNKLAGGCGSSVVSKENPATGITSQLTGSPTKSKIDSNKKKMVAVQEMKKSTQNHRHNQHQHHHGREQHDNINAPATRENNTFDSGEDLSYGPGIVSKLRCRYLSLALRESMEKQRHSMENLRRATSLNNLLDRDERQHASVAVTDDENLDLEELQHIEQLDDEKLLEKSDVEKCNKAGNILKQDGNESVQQDNKKKRSAIFQKRTAASSRSPAAAQPDRTTTNGAARMAQAQNCNASSANNSGGSGAVDPASRSRHVKRGNDSLKRARSVEALLCEKSPWNFIVNRSSLDSNDKKAIKTAGTAPPVTIEDKIHNARDRLLLGTDHMPPKRLTSIIDDTERPPPDVVKQTRKMFEVTANRRGRVPNSANGKGEVASKVANYKSIIKDQKPAIVLPKPHAATSPMKRGSASGTGAGGCMKLIAKPVFVPLGAADLLGSPLGLKTTAAAAAAAAVTDGSGSSSSATSSTTSSPQHESTTRKLLSTSEKREKSNDLLPSSSTAATLGMVDSPVTALTKKLEKLRIDNISPASKGGQSKQRQQRSLLKPSKLAGAIVSATNDASDSDGIDSNGSLVGGDAASVAAAAIVGVQDEGGDKNSDRASAPTPAAAAVTETGSTGSSTASSDRSDDEYGTASGSTTATKATKRITRTALENIAKVDSTQEYKFVANTSSTSAHEIPASVLLNATPGKQIGVIRPLHTNNTSLTSTISQTNSFNSNLSGNQHQQQIQQQHMETLKHSQAHYLQSSPVTHPAHSTPPPLTSREIEKNRINEMKKTSALADISNASVSPSVVGGGTTTSLDTVINTVVTAAGAASSGVAGGTGASPLAAGLSELDATNSPLWALRKKRQPPVAVAENTTMVFNFSNRKEVPDYIENDGVIFRRKRELPKPNESGFVLLGDLSLETSTDTDCDDFSMCPPSPCDVEFENANIVIDGKSSIRQKSKDVTCRVQFNDTLTSTFEYPSEASLIVDDSFGEPYRNDLVSAYENLMLEESDSPLHHPHQQHHHVAVDEIIPLPTVTTGAASPASISVTPPSATTTSATKSILGNLPLGSAPLGFYTPVKASIGGIFQLGVTRAPNSNANSSTPLSSSLATTNGNAANTNGVACDDGGSIIGIKNGLLNGGDNSSDGPASLEYLKPANDNLTIPYSEGTQKTDLLY